MERSEIAGRVRGQLATLIAVGSDFADTDQLAQHGLDSLSSVQLTLNLEDSFGLFFEDDEISLANFSTVESIVNLLEKRLHV
jgi:acyl carrier protein